MTQIDHALGKCRNSQEAKPYFCTLQRLLYVLSANIRKRKTSLHTVNVLNYGVQAGLLSTRSRATP